MTESPRCSFNPIKALVSASSQLGLRRWIPKPNPSSKHASQPRRTLRRKISIALQKPKLDEGTIRQTPPRSFTKSLCPYNRDHHNSHPQISTLETGKKSQPDESQHTRISAQNQQLNKGRVSPADAKKKARRQRVHDRNHERNHAAEEEKLERHSKDGVSVEQKLQETVKLPHKPRGQLAR